MADIKVIEYKGFTVEVRSDSVFFTAYDSFGEPCGTIQRPSRLHGNKDWLAHVGTGQCVQAHGVGPRQCLRSIAIYHGA
jgi:hypothetical protein